MIFTDFCSIFGNLGLTSTMFFCFLMFWCSPNPDTKPVFNWYIQFANRAIPTGNIR